jgi:aspartate kinase
VVPRARKLDYISYEETLEMASLGARVMHPRSVELAERHKLRVTVRSSFNDRPGTELVSREAVEIETGTRVRAVVGDADVARITVEGVPDAPGLAQSLFQPLAEAGVNVDIIVQNLGHGGATDISFTVERGELESALQIVRQVAEEVGAPGVTWSNELAKISIVGIGMRSGPGVAARMFGTLAEKGINIISITTSEILVTCLIEESRLQEASRALHTAFELDD